MRKGMEDEKIKIMEERNVEEEKEWNMKCEY